MVNQHEWLPLAPTVKPNQLVPRSFRVDYIAGQPRLKIWNTRPDSILTFYIDTADTPIEIRTSVTSLPIYTSAACGNHAIPFSHRDILYAKRLASSVWLAQLTTTIQVSGPMAQVTTAADWAPYIPVSLFTRLLSFARSAWVMVMVDNPLTWKLFKGRNELDDIEGEHTDSRPFRPPIERTKC